MAFFDDIRLPVDVERGARGGPGFKTTIIPLNSGFERRNKDWEKSRGTWNVGYGIAQESDLQAVINTFYAVNGSGDGFRFKDWPDYRIGNTADVDTRQLIGTTDGTTATFQTFKRYTAGSAIYDRDITKIVVGTYRLWENNVEITEGAGAGEFQIDNNTGIVTLGSTLAAQSGTEIEIICEFDVPVRFDTDQLDVTTTVFHLDEAVINIPNIPIKEIRV